MNSGMHSAGHLTALGWTSCALYFLAALLAFRAAAVSRLHDSPAIARLWHWLAAALALLGLNKAIELQTWFIAAGRQVVRMSGLPEYRNVFHAVFFLVFMLGLISLLVVLIFRLPVALGRFGRHWPLAAAGCALICVYIVIRAAFIEHVDQILGLSPKPIPFLWLLETGGLLLIIVDALRCLRPTS